MATLAIQTPTLTGVAMTDTAASAGGDEFPNDGKTFLRVRNADASSKTITVDSQQPCSQGVDHNVSVVVGAGETREIGPLIPVERFNVPSTGRVQVTYSAVTNTFVAAIRRV